jgi:hypothetical protein
MPIKTYRALIPDGGQDRLSLHTTDGKTGYRIKKFQLFPNQPGEQDYESTVQIFKFEQETPSTTTATVDFSDGRLLGACYWAESSSASYNSTPDAVIFDTEVFNQDIFITHTNTTGSEPINYYIELEQVALSNDDAAVATLKDMRST